MSTVKLSSVLSFTSQGSQVAQSKNPSKCTTHCSDDKYPASNLLRNAPWLCSLADARRGCSEVSLRLARCCVISHIDIGNYGSLTVEVQVSRCGDDQYYNLINASTFMSASDSRQSVNRNSVRMFKTGDFDPKYSQQPWDRIKLICSQPYGRTLKFGISFLKLMSDTDNENNLDSGQETPKSDLKNFMKQHQGESKAVCPKDTWFKGAMQGKLQQIVKSGKTSQNNDRSMRMVMASLKSPAHKTPLVQQLMNEKAAPTSSQPTFMSSVRKFFRGLDLTQIDAYTMKVSELRHSFEKVKCRKLSSDEKKLFKRYALEFFETRVGDGSIQESQKHADGRAPIKKPPSLPSGKTMELAKQLSKLLKPANGSLQSKMSTGQENVIPSMKSMGSHNTSSSHVHSLNNSGLDSTADTDDVICLSDSDTSMCGDSVSVGTVSPPPKSFDTAVDSGDTHHSAGTISKPSGADDTHVNRICDNVLAGPEAKYNSSKVEATKALSLTSDERLPARSSPTVVDQLSPLVITTPGQPSLTAIKSGPSPSMNKSIGKSLPCVAKNSIKSPYLLNRSNLSPTIVKRRGKATPSATSAKVLTQQLVSTPKGLKQILPKTGRPKVNGGVLTTSYSSSTPLTPITKIPAQIRTPPSSVKPAQNVTPSNPSQFSAPMSATVSNLTSTPNILKEITPKHLLKSPPAVSLKQPVKRSPPSSTVTQGTPKSLNLIPYRNSFSNLSASASPAGSTSKSTASKSSAKPVDSSHPHYVKGRSSMSTMRPGTSKSLRYEHKPELKKRSLNELIDSDDDDLMIPTPKRANTSTASNNVTSRSQLTLSDLLSSDEEDSVNPSAPPSNLLQMSDSDDDLPEISIDDPQQPNSHQQSDSCCNPSFQSPGMPTRSGPVESTDSEDSIQCPICGESFPQSVIEAHASDCVIMLD